MENELKNKLYLNIINVLNKNKCEKTVNIYKNLYNENTELKEKKSRIILKCKECKTYFDSRTSFEIIKIKYHNEKTLFKLKCNKCGKISIRKS